MKSKLISVNKRGVSPLIATVLLISFAVALGSVVLNWGSNLDIPGNQCSKASIKIRNIGDSEVCYSGSGQDTYINFIIENKGKVDISGLGIWIIGKKGTRLIDLKDFVIKKGATTSIKDNSVSYDTATYGKIKQIQFIPKVQSTDFIDICSSSLVKTDKISACS